MLSSEAASNARKRGRPKANEEVGGLRLGCRPFAAACTQYLERRKRMVKPNTFAEEERKYPAMAATFEELKAQGKVRSTDPRRIDEDAIWAYVAWMRSPTHTKERRPLTPSTQTLYLRMLERLLTHFGNHVIAEMRRGGADLPKAGERPIRAIAEDDLDLIFEAVRDMTGWRGSVAEGMVALYFGTGVRPTELRTALFCDLNLKKHYLHVRNPKGLGKWAEAEDVEIIREDMEPLIRRYVKERAEYLRERGVLDHPALFPSLHKDSKDGFYSANGFRMIKARIEETSGVEFKLKDFRSTLTSITVDEDPSLLNSMSVQLRHKNTTTTQRFYARTQKGKIGRQLRERPKERMFGQDTKNPAIHPVNFLTGYT